MMHLTRRRGGFTILEIIIALTIFSLIGVVLTKLLLGQSTNFARDVSSRKARSGARSAMNVMISDLRMAQDTLGVVTANDSTFTFKAPTVFGLICANTAASTIVVTVPADSFVVAQLKYGGYAVRNNVAPYNYTFISSGASGTKTAGLKTLCSALAIPMRPDTVKQNGDTGYVYTLTPGNAAITSVGQPAFIYQTLTYRFRASTAYPGFRGLYRAVYGITSDSLVEEIMAPFTSAARFSYYITSPTVASRDSAMRTPPANVNTIRGVEVILASSASDTVKGSKRAAQSLQRTSIFFKNSRNP